MKDSKEKEHRISNLQDMINNVKDEPVEENIEDIEEAEKKYGVTVVESETATKNLTLALEDLTDEQLRNAGLTEEEIRLFRDVAKHAKLAGMSIEDYAKLMSENDGRTLIVDSFKNIGKVLVETFTVIGQAWKEIFDPVSIVGVWNAIRVFNEWTKTLKDSLIVYDETTGEIKGLTETGEKVKSVFKGVFAILDIITTLVGGGLKIAFKIVSALFEYFGMTVLDVAAWLGDAAVSLSDWLNRIFDFTKIIEKIVPPISKAIKAVKGWIDANVDFVKIFENITSALQNGAGAISDWFASLKDKTPKEIADSIAGGLKIAVERIGEVIVELKGLIKGKITEIGSNFSLGFAGGIWDGIKRVAEVIYHLGSMALQKLMEVLNEHSPSKETHEIGVNFVQGFINGIIELAGKAWDKIKEFGAMCIAKFKELDFGKVLAAIIGVGMIMVVNRIVHYDNMSNHMCITH